MNRAKHPNPITHVSQAERSVRRQYGRTRVYHHALGVLGAGAAIYFGIQAGSAYADGHKAQEAFLDTGTIAAIGVTAGLSANRRNLAAREALGAVKAHHGGPSRFDPGMPGIWAGGAQVLGAASANVLTSVAEHNALVPGPTSLVVAAAVGAGVLAAAHHVVIHPRDKSLMNDLHLTMIPTSVPKRALPPAPRIDYPYPPNPKTGGY